LGKFLIRSSKFLYGLNPNTLWARAQQRKREDRPSEFKRIETTRIAPYRTPVEPEPILTKSKLGCGAERDVLRSK
jgi:hypothetical protein